MKKLFKPAVISFIVFSAILIQSCDPYYEKSSQDAEVKKVSLTVESVSCEAIIKTVIE